MAKPRSRTSDYFVYVLVRLLVCALQAISFETARSLAGLIARIGFFFDRRHRETTIENMRWAFGDQLTDGEREQMAREVYRHYATVLMEVIHLPRKFHVHNWKRFVDVEDGQRLLRAVLNERPLLIVTGHYGNWEMAGYALSMLGFRSYAVARPLDNPFLDRYLRGFRERTGQKLLAKKGELDRIESILKSGEIVCTLADQDAGPRGLFVEYFGRPASTHKAIALLALDINATILVVTARKLGEPMQYRIEVGDVIHPDQYAHEPDATRKITQRFTTALEHLVRRDPCQYLWLHRRWKHQPSKRAKKAA